MRNVVITGATGAIGMALIEKLIQEKVNILILAHKNSNRNSYIEEYKSTTDSFSIDIQ
ncbi:MAG: NAD-dependent epimerase/dehydratase family protein, partial [Lachnoanaerobaculum gingivalis]